MAGRTGAGSVVSPLTASASPKSRASALRTLHSLIEFAIDDGWMIGENQVRRVAKPALAEADPDVRFLETEEVAALLHAMPDDQLGRVERVMYVHHAFEAERELGPQHEAGLARCSTRWVFQGRNDELGGQRRRAAPPAFEVEVRADDGADS